MRIGAGIVALGCAAAMSTADAGSYKVIYTAPPGQPLYPVVGAVSRGVIYGTDPNAGDGFVFTLSTGGTSYHVLHTFTGADGSVPNVRLVVLAGTIFGTTRSGGSVGGGTVFAMSPTGSLLWSHSFQPATEGETPLDGLAAGPDGFLYGTNSSGAIAPGSGSLFRVGHNGHVDVLYKFKSRADGHCPFTGVVIDGAGDVYGTTAGYGFGGQPTGTLWKMLTGGTPKTQYAFKDGNDGEYPEITPTLDGAGHLWGVTQNGTGPQAGAVWMMSGGRLPFVYDFTGGADGFLPNAPLLLGPDGNLYGTTYGGGSAAGGNGRGTLFRITTTGTPTVTTVHVFAGGADGAVPTGSLAVGKGGHIFGGTEAGTIFEYTP